MDTLRNYSMALEQTACQQLFALNISQQLCKQLIARCKAVCKLLDSQEVCATGMLIHDLQVTAPSSPICFFPLIVPPLLQLSFLQIATDNLESELTTSPKKTNNIAEAINTALA